MTLASYPVENGRIRTLLDEKACYYCHSRHTVLPGYARLPGMSQLSRYDVERGLKNFQIDALFESLQNGTPPP